MYVVTGNAFGSGFGYSDSALQLSPDLQSVRSYFAPANWQQLNAGDVDLGSVGATVLPGLDRVVIIGKEGVLYLLQAGKLGEIGGQIATRKLCSGGYGGTADGDASSVTGGNDNHASANYSSVNGGQGNYATGFAATVSGRMSR